jgi:hypothetical protein
MKRAKKARKKSKPKSEPKGTAPASKELSEDQLDQVAGGAIFMNYAAVSSGGENPTESLSLNFAKVTTEYKPQ